MGTLRLPVTDVATNISGSINPFVGTSTTQDRFIFTVTGAVTVSATAPGAGVVSAADSTSVTLFHSSRLSSKVSGTSFTPSVRVGDYVAASGTIGTVTNLTALNYFVYVDGTVACPYSLIPQSDRSAVNLKFAAMPCQ